jgi:hypothetical protein
MQGRFSMEGGAMATAGSGGREGRDEPNYTAPVSNRDDDWSPATPWSGFGRASKHSPDGHGSAPYNASWLDMTMGAIERVVAKWKAGGIGPNPGATATMIDRLEQGWVCREPRLLTGCGASGFHGHALESRPSEVRAGRTRRRWVAFTLPPLLAMIVRRVCAREAFAAAQASAQPAA